MKTAGYKKKIIISLALLGLLSTAFVGTSRAAVTGIINVSVTSDDTNPSNGTCSLREAVQAANTNDIVDGCSAGSPSGTDHIYVPGAIGTYTLSSLDGLTITTSLRITGESTSGVIIDAGSFDRVFFIDAPDQVVILENMTLINGEATNVGTINTIDYGLSGGAIFNNSLLTINNVVFENNDALTSGGGLKNIGTAELYNVSFTGNQSRTGAAISNDGTLIITQGVIYNNGEFATGVEQDRLGGGIDNDRAGIVTLINVTFSGNKADEGGGIRNEGNRMDIVNSTIVHNSGNIVNKNSLLSIQNSIVGLSEDFGVLGEVPPDCVNSGGTFTSLGYNIDTDASCNLTGTGDWQGVSTAALNLGTLQNNGGPTLTHAIQPGSLAINGVVNNSCPEIDQRGYYRSHSSHYTGPYAACDIGAYEAEGLFVLYVYLPLVQR